MSAQPTPRAAKHPRTIAAAGASAGRAAALLARAEQLPAAFAPPVLVVLRAATSSRSPLPELLSSARGLRAQHSQNGQVAQPRTIHRAPPGHHPLLKDDRVQLIRGLRENRFWLCADALFCPTPSTHGLRVLGVGPTRYLADGAPGSWLVRHLGGRAAAQGPPAAKQPTMPTNAQGYQ